MGSECRPNKFHYDIGMSKRTRKPSNLVEEDDQSSVQAWPAAEECSVETVNGEKEKGSSTSNEAQENESKKSLKQLIGGGRSLSKHFSEEEKQLQLIVKQHDQEGLNKLKFKKIVSRYARVLGHLIKIKRKPEMPFNKKPGLQLTN